MPVSAISNAAVIDVHAHVVLAQTMGAAGALGPELGADAEGRPWFRVGNYQLNGVRYAGGPFMDVDVRLARMAERGIDFQVLSPNPLTYLHHIEARAAVIFCRTHNDALAQIVKARPDRLAGLAALPMQDVAAARDELARAVSDLGLWGAQIGTDMPRALDDSAHDEFYNDFVRLDVPLFIHPGPAGIDGPPGDPNLRRFDLDVVIGFAAQETIAVASLIFGGVIDRHPALDVCLSHGAGSSAYLSGRLAQAGRRRPWAPQALKADGAFEERLKRIWMDTHLNSGRSLSLLSETVGTERLVYGTNFAGWDEPEGGHGAVGTPPYLADNARRLMRAARRGPA